MAIKQLMLPVDSVKKDNELIRSRSNVANKTTARLLACLIAQLQDTDADFKHEYVLDIRQKLSMFQAADGRQLTQLRTACRDLADAKVWIDKPNSDDFDILLYFSSLSYRDGKLRVEFNPKMRKYLLELKAYFTQYNLLEYLSLPSIYSQKLYELLKSWEGANNKGYVEYALRDLHEYLDTPTSIRLNFKDFRIRILEKATKDINKTSLEFAWEAVKTGRTVTSIRFIFRDKMREKIEHKKAVDNQRKESDKNNKEFIKCVECAKSKKGICNGGNYAYCSLCQMTFLKEYRTT